MDSSPKTGNQPAFFGNALEAVIRICLVLLLAGWCFTIVRPFVTTVLWAMIIAIATYPAYLWLVGKLGGRRRLAAALLTAVAILVLLTPAVLLAGTAVEAAQQLATALREGSFDVPPPPPGVAEWPAIGEAVYSFWALASDNLEEALIKVGPHLRAVSTWLLAAAAGAGLEILKFGAAFLIAGVLLAHGEAAGNTARQIFRRLAGSQGDAFAQLSESTVRSVARGILGVALIQSLLAGLGFLMAGVPGAGLLAVASLFLAIIQVGPSPILILAVIYVFSTGSTTTAVVFAVWCLFVGLIDNILRPILLGRGVSVPMVVILLGTIGGLLTMGIIGLFVGSIVLVLGYTLFLAWLRDGPPETAPVAAAEGDA